MMAIWHGLLLAINVASGFLIVQHAICNLSRWTYSIRSIALWGNAFLLAGGLRPLLMIGRPPGFGEVLLNLGVVLLSIRSTRRMYREFVAEPNGTLGAVVSGLRAWFGRAR